MVRIFSLTMIFVSIGWILLLFKPDLKGRRTEEPLRKLCAVTASLLYIGSLFYIGELPLGSNFFTMRGVLSLFENTNAALSSWLHLATIDLVIANFIFEDLTKLNWKSYWIKFCVVLLCFFAPIGFLFWFAAREFSYFKKI